MSSQGNSFFLFFFILQTDRFIGVEMMCCHFELGFSKQKKQKKKNWGFHLHPLSLGFLVE